MCPQTTLFFGREQSFRLRSPAIDVAHTSHATTPFGPRYRPSSRAPDMRAKVVTKASNASETPEPTKPSGRKITVESLL
jgi:hypothetical protein